MFILDPVNAITSIQFYRKVAAQPRKRSVGYLAYMAVLFTAAFTVFTALRIVPPFQDLMGWMAQHVPPMTFADGKVASGADVPTTVRHPDFPDMGLMIDTTRTDAVTPQMMDENKVRVYITGNAMYLMNKPGRVEVNDLSRTKGPAVEIGPQFYHEFASIFPIVIYAVALTLSFFGFLVWKAFATLFYWTMALTMNSGMDTGLSNEALAGIALYAQTLGTVIGIILLLTPPSLPLGAHIMIGVITTSSYMALALGAIKNAKAPSTNG